MYGYRLGTIRLGMVIAALLAASLVAGCLAKKENAKEKKFIDISLARFIDVQLGPVDKSDPPGGPLSHLGNNLMGAVDRDIVITYLRLVEDTSLEQLSVGSPEGAITALHSLALASPVRSGSVDDNPCTEDKNNNGKPDFADLCLGGTDEAACHIITDHEFKVSFSDCRFPDPATKRYLLHFTAGVNQSSSFTQTTTFHASATTVGTSTAYWNVNGSVTYHNGVGGVDEQLIEISYRRLNFELHDYIQKQFQDVVDLDNASFTLRGEHLVYRVLDPTGAPAIGTTGNFDGMDIFDVKVNVDDDGILNNQAPGKYRLRLAMDWEDGMVLLRKNNAILPIQYTAGTGSGVSYLFTFYDVDHLKADGNGVGCQVQVENVNDAARTFDIMDPVTSVPPLTTPCPEVNPGTGIEF
jgi:hypothetical protein